jgi:hypothetical protein
VTADDTNGEMDAVAWVRAFVLAGLTTVLCVGGHVAGGDMGVSRSGLAISVVGCAPLGLLGARCHWSPGGLLVLLGLAQVGSHLALTVTAPQTHVMHHMSSRHPSTLMLAGHLGAALLSAVVLAHADAAVEGLVNLAASLRVAVTSPLGRLAGTRLTGRDAALDIGYAPRTRVAAWTMQPIMRRGPPLAHSS